jgi:biogenesis of lysosome-related organelles complex 1 subunit 2
MAVFCQGTNNQLSLIEKMNDRVAQEYSNYGDVAAGLRVFVEQGKNQGFDGYVSQIDAIDGQVTEFEAVMSMLDKHVSLLLLEKRVKSAYHTASTQ